MEETILGTSKWRRFRHGRIQEKYLRSRTKRILDIVGAVVGVCIGWPILAVAMVIIRIVDRVPPVFSQSRFGLYGHPYIIYKLRTLTVIETPDMLTQDRVERKPSRDPRCTRTGEFWRINSIDEIPQFWNVLKGEMSLVGYRPFPYYYTPRLSELPGLTNEDVKNYLGIIGLFRPGVTSLSSVNGRSKLLLQEKMEYDMIYATRASFWYDFKIILRTLIVLVTREGAY